MNCEDATKWKKHAHGWARLAVFVVVVSCAGAVSIMKWDGIKRVSDYDMALDALRDTYTVTSAADLPIIVKIPSGCQGGTIEDASGQSEEFPIAVQA